MTWTMNNNLPKITAVINPISSFPGGANVMDGTEALSASAWQMALWVYHNVHSLFVLISTQVPREGQEIDMEVANSNHKRERSRCDWREPEQMTSLGPQIFFGRHLPMSERWCRHKISRILENLESDHWDVFKRYHPDNSKTHLRTVALRVSAFCKNGTLSMTVSVPRTWC
jgi:hypothetical protein